MQHQKHYWRAFLLTLLFGLLARSAAATTEEQILSPSDGALGDNFAASVDVDGETAVMGAPLHDLGVGDAQGAAYVFDRSGGVWSESDKLIAPDGVDFDQFGSAVGISGDTLVVGAEGAPIGGNSSQGAAYVFERASGGTLWTFTKKLEATTAIANLAEYGASVTIDGDIIVVGSPKARSSAEGRAFVYYRDEGGTDNWGEVVELSDDLSDSNAEFGASVALDGDLLVVGASGLDVVVFTFENEGGAYVFGRDEGGLDNWGKLDLLRASDFDGNDDFGAAVAIAGTQVVVGAFANDGVPGFSTGSAYVFESATGAASSWTESSILIASDESAFAFFGRSVAAADGSAWSGASGHASGLGRGYRYDRDEGGMDNWGESDMLDASDGMASDGLGASMAAAGAHVIVGAPFGGDGAAYIYVPEPSGPLSVASGIGCLWVLAARRNRSS
jgi:hypothetical protein